MAWSELYEVHHSYGKDRGDQKSLLTSALLTVSNTETLYHKKTPSLISLLHHNYVCPKWSHHKQAQKFPCCEKKKKCSHSSTAGPALLPPYITANKSSAILQLLPNHPQPLKPLGNNSTQTPKVTEASDYPASPPYVVGGAEGWRLKLLPRQPGQHSKALTQTWENTNTQRGRSYTSTHWNWSKWAAYIYI